jgi:hypothetical protein
MQFRTLVVKSRPLGDLVRAIDEVQYGTTYLSPGISQAVVQATCRSRSCRATR